MRGARHDGRVGAGDAVFFFNFRADRARELTLAFVDPSFGPAKGFGCGLMLIRRVRP